MPACVNEEYMAALARRVSSQSLAPQPQVDSKIGCTFCNLKAALPSSSFLQQSYITVSTVSAGHCSFQQVKVQSRSSAFGIVGATYPARYGTQYTGQHTSPARHPGEYTHSEMHQAAT